jgi:prepilin-type N-terminal cleavage/methylation domain-containing protein
MPRSQPIVLRGSSFGRPGPGRASAGFTIPEMMIATSLFALLVLGIIAANLFGLRWYQLGQTEMVATDSARMGIGRMTDELRMCSNAVVGNVTNGTFLAHVSGEQLTGNGLLIYPNGDTNNYVLYFLNPTNQTFFRFTSTPATNFTVALCVTNTNVFELQDCFGNLLTNNQNNCVVHCSLEFYSAVHQSSAATSYQLQTSVAPRSMN